MIGVKKYSFPPARDKGVPNSLFVTTSSYGAGAETAHLIDTPGSASPSPAGAVRQAGPDRTAPFPDYPRAATEAAVREIFFDYDF